LNTYIICLRFTPGSTIKRTVQVGRLVSESVQSRGEAMDGKIPFPLMTKGEIFIIGKYRISRRKSTEAWFQGG
jgi:hypothetical protein